MEGRRDGGTEGKREQERSVSPSLCPSVPLSLFLRGSLALWHKYRLVAVGIVPEKFLDRPSQPLDVLLRFMGQAISDVAAPEQLVPSRVHDLHCQFELLLYDRFYRDRAAVPTPTPTRPPAQSRPQAPARPIAVIILDERNALLDVASITDDDVGLLSRRSLSEPLCRELELYILDDARLPESQFSRVFTCAPGVGSVLLENGAPLPIDIYLLSQRDGRRHKQKIET